MTEKRGAATPATDDNVVKLRNQRFTFRRFGEIKLGSGRDYLIKGLVPRHGVTVVWGAKKSGKTFLVTDMCIHIATGLKYRGRRVHRGPVIYLSLEGDGGFIKRIEALRDNHPALMQSDDALPFFVVMAPIDLVNDHRDLIQEIRGQLSPELVAVVVIDTLNRSLMGDENSSKDMRAYVEAASAVANEFRCAVIIVHHAGYDTSHPRGSTVLGANVDCEIRVSKDGDGVITAAVVSAKDMADGTAWASKLQTVDLPPDEDGDPRDSSFLVPADLPKSDGKRTWSKGLVVFREALQAAIGAHGKEHHVKGGPTVQAVTVEQVREEHKRRYLHTGDGDAGNAQRSAFKRGLGGARDRKLIGGEMIGGETLVWLNTEP
jgi:KaiC/GvpD/RAD55 family RecA-like ATPase